jgi:hypothetical protein
MRAMSKAPRISISSELPSHGQMAIKAIAALLVSDAYGGAKPSATDLCNALVKSHFKLPHYVERDRNGRLWFRVDGGARVPLPDDPTSPEFDTAYNAALVDAIAAEIDDDD